jgi:hypothetical protein
MRGASPDVHIPARALATACVLLAVVVIASLVVETVNARRDEDIASRRYADAEALVALPPISDDSLKSQVAAATNALATAQTVASPPAIDPASDVATALVVQRALAAGLAVKGIARLDAAPATVDNVAYDVQAIDVTIDGSPSRVISFLFDLNASEPSLVPSLTSLAINDFGVAHAQVVFRAYVAAASPTPVGGVPTARSR